MEKVKVKVHTTQSATLKKLPKKSKSTIDVGTFDVEDVMKPVAKKTTVPVQPPKATAAPIIQQQAPVNIPVATQAPVPVPKPKRTTTSAPPVPKPTAPKRTTTSAPPVPKATAAPIIQQQAPVNIPVATQAPVPKPTAAPRAAKIQENNPVLVNKKTGEKIVLEENTEITSKYQILKTKGATSFSRINLVKKVINDMKSLMDNHSGGGLLLAGDPGVGKTSFVRFLSSLFGLDMILIEVPHIVEEHIINIPYVKIRAANGTETRKHSKENLTDRDNDQEYEIELADSVLFNDIRNAKALPDEDYLHRLYNDPKLKTVRKVFEEFGGTETSIPKKFKVIREEYHLILFFDEFFRKTSVTIRNALRDVRINRMIGTHTIPNGVYTIFASNMTDSNSIDSIPSNYQTSKIRVASPDKDEWFNYLIDNCETNGIQVKENIFNALYEVIEPDWLSKDDTESETYMSPRRWEQLFLFINDALPIDPNIKDKDRYVQGLLSNIESVFKNYLTEDVNRQAFNRINEVVKKLVQVSNPEIDVDSLGVLPKHEWRDVLRSQIARKISLGEMRSSIPILSGPPGIGKSQDLFSLTQSFGLGLITASCTTFSFEDVIGTPLAKTGKDGNQTTQFSDSKLYIKIMEKAAALEKAGLVCSGEETNGYRFILFLDEFNRVKDQRAFNSLRKLILEREFENGKKLPEKTIIVAAINPTDSGGGIVELTKHVRDVSDIISCGASWDSFVKYTQDSIVSKSKFKHIENEDSPQVAFELIKAFADNFGNPDDEHNPYGDYHFSIRNFSHISPREYSDIFTKVVHAIDDELTDPMNGWDLTTKDENEIKELDNALRREASEVFLSQMDFILDRIGMGDSNGIYDTAFPAWFMQDPKFSVVDKYKTFTTGEYDIQSLLKAGFKGDIILSDKNEFLELLQNSEHLDASKFGDALVKFAKDENLSNNLTLLTDKKFDFRRYVGDAETGKFQVEVAKNTGILCSSVVNWIKEIFIAINVAGVGGELLDPLNSFAKKLCIEDIPENFTFEECGDFVLEVAELLLSTEDDTVKE